MDALLLLVLGTALVIATAWSRREGLFPRCSLGCGHEAEKPVREERILLLAYGLT